MTKVFVSFSHQQGKWVFDKLVPVLRAGGIEVLIDRERFRAGYAVKGQMDATQDQADRQLLIITDAYLKSDYCRHELQRALKLDQKFKQGILIRCYDEYAGFAEPSSPVAVDPETILDRDAY